MKTHHVRRSILFLFGFLFIAFGVGAFFGVPGGHDAGHHRIGHNVTHLFAGAVTLWVAFAGTSASRCRFCLAFGLAYLCLGLSGVFSEQENLRLIPGLLEFHLEDYWVQLTTAVLFLALSLFRPVPEGDWRLMLWG
jgi:hypothetical protein